MIIHQLCPWCLLFHDYVIVDLIIMDTYDGADGLHLLRSLLCYLFSKLQSYNSSLYIRCAEEVEIISSVAKFMF